MSEALGDIDDFEEICRQQSWFYHEGWIDLHTAVDNLQRLAVNWHLLDIYGQDTIQAIIAYSEASEEQQQPHEYAAQLVRQWEMDDPRDAWRHIGELPPPARVRNGAIGSSAQDYAPRHRDIPQSTIAAFNYVASRGDAEHLARWLRDHADAAPALLEQLREAA